MWFLIGVTFTRPGDFGTVARAHFVLRRRRRRRYKLLTDFLAFSQTLLTINSDTMPLLTCHTRCSILGLQAKLPKERGLGGFFGFLGGLGLWKFSWFSRINAKIHINYTYQTISNSKIYNILDIKPIFLKLFFKLLVVPVVEEGMLHGHDQEAEYFGTLVSVCLL